MNHLIDSLNSLLCLSEINPVKQRPLAIHVSTHQPPEALKPNKFSEMHSTT